MLEAYRPVSILMALWPTPEFEFPADAAQLGTALRGQFSQFEEMRVVQAAQGGELPAEMTRLALLAEGRQCVLELAPGRINLRRVLQKPEPVAALLERHGQQWLPIHSWLSERHNLRVYRMGLVAQLFCPTASSANEKIAQYFLQQRALQGQAPHEVHLDLLARLDFGEGLMINRWLRIRPLRTADTRRLDFAAQVEVDINTFAEDTRVRSGRDQVRFLDQVARHITSEIPLLSDPDFLA